MRLLFLTPQIPFPPHSGGRIVTWNTIKRFARTCDVSVVSLYHHPSEIAGLDEMKRHCKEAAAFPAHGKWSPFPALRSLSSMAPCKAFRFYNPQMFRYVRRLIERESFDVIHAQNFYTTPYVLKSDPGLKIHYKENVEGNVLLRYANASSNPLIKMAARIEGLRTRRFERMACRTFDQVLAISPIDRDALLSLDPSLPVAHQRPGVDLHEYPVLPHCGDEPCVVFTGTLSYYPNVDGVLYFLEHCWPAIRQAVPNAEFWIVGANPPPSIQQWRGRDGVRVTGRVDNIQDYLKKSQVYIVPLRVGGGIRLKILEAMASGLAMVSTPVGCEGLDVKDQTHLLVSDMPDGFARAVIDLLQNPGKRDALRKNARSQAERVYDWDVVIQEQIALYQSLMDKKGSLAKRRLLQKDISCKKTFLD